MATFVACPMCGFDFDRDDTLCSHGCPLGAMCHLIRCPSCDYEFSEIPRRYSWLARLFGKSTREPSRLPPDVRPVTTLAPGTRAEVLCVGGQQGPRPNTLAVFGLVPETEITIVQLRPACVIRVGQTELALDREIAEEILVRETDSEARRETSGKAAGETAGKAAGEGAGKAAGETGRETGAHG